MSQFFKDLVLKDLPLKLVSLLLAIATWATVTSLIEKGDRERGIAMSSYQQFARVPVSIVSSSADVSQFRVVPARVHVVVQGTPEAIHALKSTTVQAVVDLTYWDRRSEDSLPVHVMAPPGTAIVSVSPEELKIVPPEQQP